MNLCLLRPDEEAGDGKAVVGGARARHLRNVLRAKVGQRLRIARPNEGSGHAVVTALGEEVHLASIEITEPVEVPQLDVILALPRPKAVRRVLQAIASFGVRRVHLVNAWRVDKSYWSSPILSEEVLREAAWLGCEQGRQAWVPSVHLERFLVSFLGSLPEAGARFVAHPDDQAEWLGAQGPQEGRALLAFGPEGGWIADELSSLDEAGFTPVRLARGILRTEVAVAAGLGQWELIRT